MKHTSERFWAKVNKTDDCWEWTASVTAQGEYGQFMLNGRPVRAHRYSWELINGPIPRGLYVCHHCDNPRCVKPEHLFLGTARDNNMDRQQKGRGNYDFGERHRDAKLTPSTVIELRQLIAEGVLSLREIGRRFGMSHNSVRKVRDGRSWSHVA